MSEIMLFGVLRMPYEIAMADELARRQYWQRSQEAADTITRLEAEVAKGASILRAWQARAAKAEAENERLRAALSGINVYASDTLTGRVKPDPATYKEWLIEGIRELRDRARAALTQEPQR